MKNKFFIVATLLAILSLFAVSYTFATTNAVNDVRNVVGGAEKVIEDAGKGIVNGVKDGMNTVKNGAKDVGNDVKNGMNDMGRTTNNYTATRTATTTDNGLLGNVSNTVWSWLIIAIVAIVIVALVLFYANQNKNTTTYHNDDNE
jgi:predicted PurR-regulated permease PerM